MHALVCCRAPFRRERLAPAAKLEKVCIPLRPTEAVLAPLPGARDVLPNGRTIHTLTLTYKLNVAEAGKHAVTLPLLNRHALLISASTPENPPCFMTGRPLYGFTDLGLFSYHGTEEWGMGTSMCVTISLHSKNAFLHHQNKPALQKRLFASSKLFCRTAGAPGCT